jgi:hypothetical protein
MLLVRSIEWTVIEADTYDTVLEQADLILRYLLGAHLLCSFFGRDCDCLLGSSFFKPPEGSTWGVCSPTCNLRNWLLSAHLWSTLRNTWIIAILHRLGDARARDGVLRT